MNRDEIKKLLPHREPMLLLDETTPEGDEAHGRYTVRGDEWFVQGHFPGNPVVPGVVLCEMIGQNCAVLIGDKLLGKTPFFTGMNKVKFRHTVRPGDGSCELGVSPRKWLGNAGMGVASRLKSCTQDLGSSAG